MNWWNPFNWIDKEKEDLEIKQEIIIDTNLNPVLITKDIIENNLFILPVLEYYNDEITVSEVNINSQNIALNNYTESSSCENYDDFFGNECFNYKIDDAS